VSSRPVRRILLREGSAQPALLALDARPESHGEGGEERDAAGWRANPMPPSQQLDMGTQLSTVDFHGQVLQVVEKDGRPHVAINVALHDYFVQGFALNERRLAQDRS
jgi:hypothetical protein